MQRQSSVQAGIRGSLKSVGDCQWERLRSSYQSWPTAGFIKMREPHSLWPLKSPLQGSLMVVSVLGLAFPIACTFNSHIHTPTGQGVRTILSRYLRLQCLLSHPYWKKNLSFRSNLPAPCTHRGLLTSSQEAAMAHCPPAHCPPTTSRYCSMVQTVPDHQERYFQGPSA